MIPTLVASPASLASWSASAPPAQPSTPPAAPPPGNGDQFTWRGALALPAYTYSAASGTLSGLAAFADRFPAGGVTINPGSGIIANPEWTRHFEDGMPLRNAQPILAGIAATVSLARGTLELSEGLETGNDHLQMAGGLDLAIAASSALQIVSPAAGAAATLTLTAARLILEVHG